MTAEVGTFGDRHDTTGMTTHAVATEQWEDPPGHLLDPSASSCPRAPTQSPTERTTR